MKKFFLVAVLAIGSFVAVNAQTSNTTTPQHCCSRESSIDLDIDIYPILCLIPECERWGFVDYDCVDDFNAPKVFRQANNSPDYGFAVWSNTRFKVSTTADGPTFIRTGPVYPGTFHNFPVGNVEWKVKSAATLVGTPLAIPANYNTSFKTLTVVDPSPAGGANTLNDASNGIHGFVLNFQTKAGASWAHHPTQYMPGSYRMEVDITASID